MTSRVVIYETQIPYFTIELLKSDTIRYILIVIKINTSKKRRVVFLGDTPKKQSYKLDAYRKLEANIWIGRSDTTTSLSMIGGTGLWGPECICQNKMQFCSDDSGSMALLKKYRHP